MPDHEDQLRISWECHLHHSHSPSPKNSPSPSPINSRSDPPPASTRSLTWILLLFFFFTGVVLAVIYYLSSPNAPQFAVQSLAGESFRASCPWSIGLSIRNPDKLVKFSYRKITVVVSDETTTVALSSVEIPPFFIKPKSEIAVVVEHKPQSAIEKVKRSGVKTAEWQWSGLGPVDPNELGPGLIVRIHCDVWVGSPVLPIFSKRKVDVVCRDVLGSMNSPRICSSSMSSLW